MTIKSDQKQSFLPHVAHEIAKGRIAQRWFDLDSDDFETRVTVLVRFTSTEKQADGSTLVTGTFAWKRKKHKVTFVLPEVSIGFSTLMNMVPTMVSTPDGSIVI